MGSAWVGEAGGTSGETDPAQGRAPADDGVPDRGGRGRTEAAALDPRTAALVEHLTETVFLVAPSGEATLRLGPTIGPLGFSVHEEDGGPVHVAERVHPDDLVGVLALIEQVRGTPGLQTAVRVRARHKDGSWRLLEASVAVPEHPDLDGALLRIRDVTDGPAAAHPQDVTDGGARFRSLAEAVPSGILCADAKGSVVFSNDAARQLLHLPEGRLLGHGWEAAVDAEDRPDVVAAAAAVLAASPAEVATFRVRGASGQRWLHARFVPLLGEAPGGVAGEVTDGGSGTGRTGWLAAIDDITERRRYESQLAHQATHDPLTDLPNRTLLDDRLEQACARLGREGEQVAVLFCDLDEFKEVNDRFDHAVGDRVLVEAGRRIRAVLRPADTVARLGGDEFVVVCERTTASEAAEVASRIRATLARPFPDAGGTGLGVSIGIATASDPGTDAGELVLRADQAMYRHKHERRPDPA